MNPSVIENGLNMITALRNLTALALDGDAAAVRAVADIAVESADTLRKLKDAPEGHPAKKLVAEFAEIAAVWPILYPAIAERREKVLTAQVPAGLGTGITWRTRKPAGTKSDRDFRKDTRTGFTLEFVTRLDEARYWSSVYQTPADFLTDQTAKRALFELVMKSELDAPCPSAEEWCRNIQAEGWLAVWEIARDLPDLTEENLPAWLAACGKLAESLCGGVWTNGPWPEKLKGDAVVRISDEAVSEEYAHREAVLAWLGYGLNRLIIKL
jgi:hypothetical protein